MLFAGKLGAILLILCTVHGPVFGHAHIFIDYTVTAVFNDSGLVGVNTSWVFDRMFSATITKEFDVNKDGRLDKEEIKQLYLKSFRNLAKDNYFGVVKIGKKQIKVPEPTNFTASLNKSKKTVKYNFFIPLKMQSEKQAKNVSVYFYDPVIYVAFTIMKRDVKLVNPSKEIKADIKLKRVKYLNCPLITFKSNG